jgi:hypothetical protein
VTGEISPDFPLTEQLNFSAVPSPFQIYCNGIFRGSIIAQRLNGHLIFPSIAVSCSSSAGYAGRTIILDPSIARLDAQSSIVINSNAREVLIRKPLELKTLALPDTSPTKYPRSLTNHSPSMIRFHVGLSSQSRRSAFHSIRWVSGVGQAAFQLGCHKVDLMSLLDAATHPFTTTGEDRVAVIEKALSGNKYAFIEIPRRWIISL